VGKGADFKPLVPVINRWGKEVILIGRDAVEMAANFDADVRTYFANDMEDAVAVALDHAEPGDAVLLSPACASFDMFDNFQHRGHAFIQSVEVCNEYGYHGKPAPRAGNARADVDTITAPEFLAID
jgi:UDP-N-acetylmuramoylalanine--D-glutamate ligase